MRFIKKVLHPEGYHGQLGRTPYFEGWYFKIIDNMGNHRYAVIPGISLSTGGGGPHCFVQTLDGSTGITDYHSYPLDAFRAARHSLDIQIGPNSFTSKGIYLDLPDGNLPMSGRIDFSQLQPWPVSWHSPGIMGWYAWVPFMECYHGVLSFDHKLNGSLTINDNQVSFTEGRGYIEKDWGKSFPSSWVWMQSNHFSTPGTSFTASIALIPWVGYTFPGFIIGLWHNGILNRFATYTGAKTVELQLSENSVFWSVADRAKKLEIKAYRATTGELRGPSRQDMARRVPETLQADIDVKLISIPGNEILFEDKGLHGGLEIAGNLNELSR